MRINAWFVISVCNLNLINIQSQTGESKTCYQQLLCADFYFSVFTAFVTEGEIDDRFHLFGTKRREHVGKDITITCLHSPHVELFFQL